MKRTILLILAIAFMLPACSDSSPGSGELDSKSEYSILQYFEYEYRMKRNDLPFVTKKKALGSAFNVFGLPRSGAANGYVWFVANPRDENRIKLLPQETEFEVSEGVVADIEKEMSIARTVKTYILARGQKMDSREPNR